MKSSCFSSSFLGSKRAFTLIELLVVISIIALLIGILLPALGKARDAARTSICMGNDRSMGQAILQYATQYKNQYPEAYHYRVDSKVYQENGVVGSSGNNGVVNWSGIVCKDGFLQEDNKGFICPSQAVGGWVPFNYCNDAASALSATPDAPGSKFSPDLTDPASSTTAANKAIVDTQAIRLSYTGNEALMPRMKSGVLYGKDPTTHILDGSTVGVSTDSGGVSTDKVTLQYVKTDNVQKESGTILIAEFTDYTAAITGTSVSGGGAGIKSHRPANGVMNPDGSFYNGEIEGTANAGTYDSAHNTSCESLVAVSSAAAFNTAVTGFSSGSPGGFASVDPTATGNSAANAYAVGTSGNYHHIVYCSPGRHSGGFSGGGVSNFSYADGHAQSKKMIETIDPNDFQWGTHMWSQTNGAQVYTDSTFNTPVN